MDGVDKDTDPPRKPLQEPIKEKTAGNQHVCSWCHRSFKKSAYLASHIRTHTGERPYACTVKGCNNRYMRKDHLNRHLLSHTGIRKFHCSHENCGATYFYAAHLKRHEALHLSDYEWQRRKIKSPRKGSASPIAAPQNDSVAAPQSDSGKSSGTVERKNKCILSLADEEQPIKFFDETGWSFKCPVQGCEKSYTERRNCMTHLKKFHSGVRPFRCPVYACQRTFAYKHVWRKHMQRIHANVDDTARIAEQPRSEDARGEDATIVNEADVRRT